MDTLMQRFNTPALTPQMNRPRQRVNIDSTIVNRTPIKRKQLNIKMHCLLPEPKTLPASKLPIASPSTALEPTIVLLPFADYASHPYFFMKTGPV
jgi:hypothetical protein